jgi:hypothetical protein
VDVRGGGREFRRRWKRAGVELTLRAPMVTGTASMPGGALLCAALPWCVRTEQRTGEHDEATDGVRLSGSTRRMGQLADACSRAYAHAGTWPCSGSSIELGAMYGPVRGRSVHGPHEVHNDILKAPYAGASQVRHVAGASGTHARAPVRGDDVARLKPHPVKHLQNYKTPKSVNKLENLQK